jgi:asparagine synthase (glutamine-hydrolysing)
MCAIAGIIGRTRSAADDLARMLEAQKHRGPDGEGTWSDARALLGHRRLSIIDLAGGRQPLVSADGKVALVCNGEIYNYRELRTRLEAQGHRFLTHSDCEVLIALYEQYGDGLLEHVRGMFAFALWDSRRQRLLAARDHLGQKPFFYAMRGGQFVFASEIKGIVAFDPTLRRLNLEALDQYLALRLVAPPLTMFRGITKLPPGHLLVLERHAQPVVRRYWDVNYEPKVTGSLDELVDELEEKLEDSLRLHLTSDVPVGAFLSGGLDSGLIVSMLSQRLGVQRLPTFTIGLAYQRFDEAPHARMVADLAGTQHHEQRLSPSLTSLLPDLLWHLDEPSDPLSLCGYLLARFARQHVKVAIGGDGGDELFGGYDRYYGNLYVDRYARVPAMIRRYLVGPALSLVPASGWYKSIGHQLRWMHRLSFLQDADRYAASLNYFYCDPQLRRDLFSSEARRALPGAAEEAIRTCHRRKGASAPLDRMLYADSMIRLPDHPVFITDRMSMAHGLEVRSPFMDHRLVEFAARLPCPLKVRGRMLRYIQRCLSRRYLPEKILDRPKQGFASALPYILRREYRLLYETCLLDAELVRAGVWNREPIERLLQEHLSNREDHGNRLWLLINAELWYRMMILGRSREDLRDELGAAGLAQAA